MSDQTIREIALLPGTPAVLTVDTGTELRIRLRRPHAVVSLVGIDTADPLARLSMYTTQSVNHAWRIGAGHVLVDTEARTAWTVRAAQGGIYVGGGYCGRLLDVPPGGRRDAGLGCGSIFADRLAAYGYDERQLGPDSYVTGFVTPEYAPDGRWWVRPSGAAGDVLSLVAAYPQRVAALVCPHHPLSPDPAAGPAAVLSTQSEETRPSTQPEEARRSTQPEEAR